MLCKRHIALVTAMTCLLVLQSCNALKKDKPWTPTAQQWEGALKALAKASFPIRYSDSLNWPDTVTASRDFLVTSQNFFATVLSWRYDSQLFCRGMIGRYGKGELKYISVGPELLTGAPQINNYQRLKSSDSLWTILSEGEFWKADNPDWDEPLRNPSWMCDHYHRSFNMVRYLGIDRLSPVHSRKAPTPDWGIWLGDLGYVAFSKGSHMLLLGKDSVCDDCTVDWVEYHGDFFASIVSVRLGGERIYQAIAGRHFGDSIFYRRLLDKPRLVAGQEFGQYTHLTRADSLWTLVGPREWWESERSLQQMFDQAAKFYVRDSIEVYRFPLK
ncbi:MAG: hypothetical protein HY851_06500 [candidate division Zixibacteria bacterium]|nr:hypothetical protein [candidate division Zixibacteria bacterium]